VTNEHGCPRIRPDQNEAGLRFNLSNTDGLVACAVTVGRDVGVDVELPKDFEHARLAERYFAAPEVEALRSLPPAAQRERFFRVWTLKEAYIKAREMGLAIPLGDFWLDLDQPGPIGIAFAPRLDDRSGEWQFVSEILPESHAFALAVRSGAAALEVQTRFVVPLRHERSGF
jgi:4'-phosphopantetheinyl transferase